MKNIPSVLDIKEYINPKHFKINLYYSFYHLIKDLFLWSLTSYFIYFISSYNIYLDFIIKLPVQFISGFFMWCIFVIGHDCGHGLFSNNNTINTIIGEFCHSFILLTPYYPWKKSHYLHHCNHNHKDKDYSHKWYKIGEKDILGNDLKKNIFYKLI